MKGKSVGDKVIKRVLPIAFEKEKLIKDAHKNRGILEYMGEEDFKRKIAYIQIHVENDFFEKPTYRKRISRFWIYKFSESCFRT
ncbi:hypothetical protein TU51_09635 [Bacillus cytotoxicus]|nr:hypothetical protein CG482_010095 [Bacillus cytotoxicus]AWC36763.1 hypothetical protein CG481_010110 [Bacillus cytotoxicus]AWC44790.1 hypothetical protein CG479_009820 [Bacillus cytotoxicus]AWC61021.1 hypothetical protein CG474_010170 [Bacillus cytotoxicus]KMT51204.1 hypothetical protein TU51_09635 [Bacillus cytotoxicus]